MQNCSKTISSSLFNQKKNIILLFLLVIITFFIYWPVGDNGFIDLDDNAYITENRYVQQGLNVETIAWAFQFNNTDYWLPLTWLSHMLDCDLFGLQPGFHHLTSLLIHTINSLLLFIFLQKTTGYNWESALVAAFFSLHPINVDSVAWIAERKNVLSAFFWMLTMLAYTRYVNHSNITNYLITLFFLILGNMAKPMLITLPFVLLLLDYWPLGRMQLLIIGHRSSAIPFRRFMGESKKLIYEKIPFFIVSALSILITSLSLQKLGHVISNETVPIKMRLANAIVSYIKYIGKAIWPQNFSIHYPYPAEMIPAWQYLGSIFLIIVISIYVIRNITKKPYLITGWLWFLGTFVPAIGITFSGTWGAINDRFAYIPFIGLFIAVVWGIFSYDNNRCFIKRAKITMGTICIIILALMTRTQVKHWKDSVTLFQHSLMVTENNYFVHNLLGVSLAKQGRKTEAVNQFNHSIRIRPSNFEAYNNLGIALSDLNQPEEAMKAFSIAIQLSPTLASAYNNMGNLLSEKRRIDEAEKYYFKAIQLRPDYADAYNNLGILYFSEKRIDKSIECFKKALNINPDFHKARFNLDFVLSKQDKGKAQISN